MTRILVVENDSAFAATLRDELTRLGCAVRVFGEGNPGLIAAANDPPDLILVSVELPRINGFSLCNKIKKDTRLNGIPLIITSSHSSSETFEQHQRLPTRAQDYVHKPIAFDQLLPRLQRFVAIAPSPASPERPPGEDGEEYVTVQMSADAIREELADYEIAVDVETDGGEEEAPAAPYMLPPPGAGAAVEPALQRFPRARGEADESERTRVVLDLGRQRLVPPSVHPPRASEPPPGAGASQLREALAASKRALQAALLQLSQAKQNALAPEELARLQTAAAERDQLERELSAARERRSIRPEPTTNAEREALELREQLNARDREMMGLRDQLSAKDRTLIDLREATAVHERELAASWATIDELRVQLEAATKRGDEIAAEKELADKRAEDFKQGAKTIAEQLNLRSKELRDLQGLYDEARRGLSAATERHQERVAGLEGELRETQKAHGDELTRLGEDRRVALEEAAAAAAKELAAVEGRLGAELEALRGEREQALEEARALGERLVERDAELGEATRALREARMLGEQQRLAHEAELAEQNAAREALAEAAAETQRLVSDQEQALAAREQELAEARKAAHDGQEARKAAEDAATSAEDRAHQAEQARKAAEDAAQTAETRAQDLEQAFAAREQQLAEALKAAEDHQEARRAAEETASSAETRAQDLEQALKTRERELAEARKRAQGLDEALKARGPEIEEARKAARAEEDAHRITRVEAQKNAVQAAREHEQALKAARAEAKQLAAQLAREHEQALKSTLAEADKEHREVLKAALGDRDRELRAALDALEKQHAQALSAESVQHQGVLANMQARVAELEGALKAAGGDSSEVHKELTVRLGTSISRVSALTAERDELRTKLTAAEQAVEAERLSVADDLAQAIEERDDLHAQCESLGEQVLQMSDELEAARARIAELGGEAE